MLIIRLLLAKISFLKKGYFQWREKLCKKNRMNLLKNMDWSNLKAKNSDALSLISPSKDGGN
jgi:hypothetical protein